MCVCVRRLGWGGVDVWLCGCGALQDVPGNSLKQASVLSLLLLDLQPTRPRYPCRSHPQNPACYSLAPRITSIKACACVSMRECMWRLHPQPKEAAFALALLHPDPTARPTVSELLASDALRGAADALRARHSAMAAQEEALEAQVMAVSGGFGGGFLGGYVTDGFPCAFWRFLSPVVCGAFSWWLWQDDESIAVALHRPQPLSRVINLFLLCAATGLV